MRLFVGFRWFGALLCLTLALSQDPPLVHPNPKDEIDRKLPNGKSQNEEILKEDYRKSLRDAAQLVELSQSLQKDLEAETSHVLSISSLKKAEEIEKIAKRLRGRMRRF